MVPKRNACCTTELMKILINNKTKIFPTYSSCCHLLQGLCASFTPSFFSYRETGAMDRSQDIMMEIDQQPVLESLYLPEKLV